MKRFRINESDEIMIVVRHNDKLIIPYKYESGFSTLEEAKNYAKNCLEWDFKGLGRKIEIMVYNITKDKIKYINSFS